MSSSDMMKSEALDGVPCNASQSVTTSDSPQLDDTTAIMMLDTGFYGGELDPQSVLPVLDFQAASLIHELQAISDSSSLLEGFARKVRLSKIFTTVVAKSIAKCLELMVSEPNKYPDYIDVMSKLSKIQSLHVDDHAEVGLPFMKFPLELRKMVYNYSLCSKRIINMPLCDTHTVDPNDAKLYVNPKSQINNALLLTCSAIRQEALPVYYKANVFGFPCTCAMNTFFECNIGLNGMSKNLYNVAFVWEGDYRADAIHALAQTPHLANVGIILRKSTVTQATAREERIRTVFGKGPPLRIVDSEGIEEIKMFSNLDNIHFEQDKHMKHNGRLNVEFCKLKDYILADGNVLKKHLHVEDDAEDDDDKDHSDKELDDDDEDDTQKANEKAKVAKEKAAQAEQLLILQNYTRGYLRMFK